MAVYFPEIEDIYFPKTKEYFQEIMSSYSNGNYRSAIVMLYSVAICDMLFKLQELKDMFNDTIAEEILREVEKCRNEHDNKSKSRWEKEFIDNIYKKTHLLDLESYTNLNHLYDHRNFSAHPALNENYELISPSKEVTIAHIKNLLQTLFVKPPIFVKNIISTLSEDLKDKNAVYNNSYSDLKVYLENKYFSKMPESMKLSVFKALWKFCFLLPDDEDCKNNLKINRMALSILINQCEAKCVEYVKENSRLFGVAHNDKCLLNLVILLSEHPSIYPELETDVVLQLNEYIDREEIIKFIAWFKYSNTADHLDALKNINYIKTSESPVKRISNYYSNIGKTADLMEFFIHLYGESASFNTADARFEKIIEPFLEKMTHDNFVHLITVSNENNQIYGRYASINANDKIMSYARESLGKDFDYSKFEHFEFSQETPDSNKTSCDGSSNEDWEI